MVRPVVKDSARSAVWKRLLISGALLALGACAAIPQQPPAAQATAANSREAPDGPDWTMQ